MNKIVLGLLLGGLLGIFDGLTSWFTPEVRPASRAPCSSVAPCIRWSMPLCT